MDDTDVLADEAPPLTVTKSDKKAGLIGQGGQEAKPVGGTKVGDFLATPPPGAKVPKAQSGESSSQKGFLDAPPSGAKVSEQKPQKPVDFTNYTSHETRQAVVDQVNKAFGAKGLDPQMALKVAGSEGLGTYVGDGGSSFGPFQLHYGGMAGGGNSGPGLGDEFTKATGLHASDPNTVPQQIAWVADHVAKHGWDPNEFHGMKSFNGQKLAPMSPGQRQDFLSRADSEAKKAMGYDPSVDYGTGASWATQLAVAKADNPNEAAAELERSVGAGNFGQDKGGRWWVKEGDKKVSVLPSGGFSNTLKALPVHLMAGASPTAGALAGGAAGTEVAGPIGGVVGAGLGGAAGYGLEEAAKYLKGTQRKTPTEEAIALIHEGEINAALPVIGAVPGAAASAVRALGHTTRESEALTKDALRGGIVPPLASASPRGFGAFKYDQNLRNYTGGDPQEEKKINWVLDQAKRGLAKAGFSSDEAADMLFEAKNQSRAISSVEANNALAAASQDIVGFARVEIASARAAAEAELAGQLKALNDLANRNLGRLGIDLGKSIVDARVAFGHKFDRIYSIADQMTGDAKIVDPAPAIDFAKAFIDENPPLAVPKFISDLAVMGDAEVPKKWTFTEAHNWRSRLRSLGQIKNLTPNAAGKVFRDGGAAVDDAIEAAADNIDGSISDELAVKAMAARDLLKEADRQYKEGIAQFKNAQFNALVKDIADDMTSDPEKIAYKVFGKGHLEETKRIWGIATPDQKLRLRDAYLKGMLTQAAGKNGLGETILDGKAFHELLSGSKEINQTVFPKPMLDEMTRLSKEYAVLQGKYDIDSVRNESSPAMLDMLYKAVESAKTLDQFVKEHPLGALSSGSPKTVDAAIGNVLKMGASQMRWMHDTVMGLPNGADIWHQVTSYAMKDMLHGAFNIESSRLTYIQGKKITEWLSKYDQEQLEMMFGADLLDDIDLLAKKAYFAFPRELGDIGTSLAAAQLKAGLWHSVKKTYKYVEAQALGWVSDRPWLIKVFANLSDDEKGAVLSQNIWTWLMKHNVPGAKAGRDIDAWTGTNRGRITATAGINAAAEGPGSRAPKPEQPSGNP